METNMNCTDWVELISKHDVIRKLNVGEKFSSVNIDLGLDPNSDALRKALKRLGYKKDKYQGIYYIENYQEEIVKFMNSIDVEEEIDQIAEDRYYRCIMDSFYGEEVAETVSVEIDKEIYEEYVELAEHIGCDLEDEFMTLILLRGLEKYKPVNKRREHYIRYMNESDHFSKEEIEFIMQKEKEGYDLESLVLVTNECNILELTREELETYKR